MSPEMFPKSFDTFKKRAPAARPPPPPPPSSPLDILKDDEMLAGAGWSLAFRRNSTEV